MRAIGTIGMRTIGIVFALLPALAALVQTAAAEDVQATTARITYLAGNSVYVEAGRGEGLALGDTLTVVRGGDPIAVLRIAYLSTHRAACEILSQAAAPGIGDLVRFHARSVVPPVLADAPPAADDSTAAPPSAGPRALAAPPVAPAARQAPRSLRGRIGARYLGTQSRDSGDFGQLGLDLRLDGDDLGHRPVDVTADVRSRHSATATLGSNSGSSTITRVYRLSASVHGWESNRRVTVGRQSSTALGAVSLFDGVNIEFGGERWTTGVFSGTQPEPEALGLSAEIIEYGAYGGWRQAAGQPRQWSLVGGGVASYQDGELNRDFIFLQGYYRDPRLSLSLGQEVDVNYGWKRAAGDPALLPTSTFLSARAQVSPALDINAGYDNRRNVRLYRDRETPATEFDDRLRQGLWAGAGARAGRHLSLGGDIRFHGDGSDAGRGHSWSLHAGTARLAPLGARAGVRWTSFTGDRTESQLLGLTIGLDAQRRVHAELSGGWRHTADRIAELAEREFWEGADIDVTLGNRTFLTVGVEHVHGSVDRRFDEELGLSWGF